MTETRESLADSAARQLEDAGFVVERHARLPLGDTGRTLPVDLVAWVTDADGQLRCKLVVEVKARKRGQRSEQDALARLARIANIVPIGRALLFDGGWREPDETFSKFSDVAPPTRPYEARDQQSILEAREPTQRYPGYGARALASSYAPDRRPGASLRHDPGAPSRGMGPGTLARGRAPSDLVQRTAWKLFDEARDKGQAPEIALFRVLEQLGPEPHSYDPLVREILEDTGDRVNLVGEIHDATLRRSGVVGIPTRLGLAMARLLLPSASNHQTLPSHILDPMCGIGSCLVAMGAWLHDRQVDAELVGWESRNEGARKLAGLMLNAAGLRRVVDDIDVLAPAMSTDWPAIISCLPMSWKLSDDFSRKFGTREGDVLALRQAVELLAPNGRAVFAVAPRILFSRGAAEKLRADLARSVRVVAIIELPTGTLPTTAVKPVLVVIERTPPSETLMARLTEDWHEQLSPEGDFFEAYVAHLERRS